MAREFFSTHKLAYTDVNVSVHAAEAEKIFTATKQHGVPVTEVVDDQNKTEYIVGFDEPRLRDVLHVA